MNKVNQEQTGTALDHEVGEVLLIGSEEWTIGEINDDIYTLYHEGVSGTSHTLELTREELDKKIAEY